MTVRFLKKRTNLTRNIGGVGGRPTIPEEWCVECDSFSDIFFAPNLFGAPFQAGFGKVFCRLDFE